MNVACSSKLSVLPEVEMALLAAKIPLFGVVSLEPEFLSKNEIFMRSNDAYQKFISNHWHAGMFFLERNQDVRRNPAKVLSGAMSAIVVGVPYDSREFQKGEFWKYVARYARVGDYHKRIKNVLEGVGIQLRSSISEDFKFRVVVDSVPFFERSFSEMAGVGFVGKNTCLIAPGSGSFLFLGSLLTTLPVSSLTFSDEKMSELVESGKERQIPSCGECLRCVGFCPTRAIVAPFKIDARRCLAYWSIEHRGIVPDEFVPHFARTVFGCDLCQDVCPFNRGADVSVGVPEPLSLHSDSGLSVLDVARMTESQYERWFGGSALTRAKYAGLVRNVLYHLFAVQAEGLEAILAERWVEGHPDICAVVQQIRRLKG